MHDTGAAEDQYQNYEMSSSSTTAVRYRHLRVSANHRDKFDDIGGRIRVLRHPGTFNYSG